MTAPKPSTDPLYKLLRDEEIAAFNKQRVTGASYDFRGCSFRGSDLRGLEAAGIAFRDAYFRDADWRKAAFERRMPRRMRHVPPAPTPLRLEYVREPDISESLDRELRALIAGCFPQPRTAFFAERRYAHEMPLHRYLLRDADARLVAHLAVHEKVIAVADLELSIGGMAEVCVHEAERGRGRAKELLERAHRDLQRSGVAFSLLFGEPAVYGSSGYRPLTAAIRRFVPAEGAFESGPMHLALYKPLSDRAWPEGPIDLRGPTF